MATLTKKNEAVVAPFFKNGVTLQYFNLAFPSDVSAKLTATTAGARSPVAAALEAIQARVTIEVIGTVQNNGTGAGRDLRFAVAAIGGAYPTDNYDGTAGTEALADYLEDLVQAAGTHQSVALASCAVTAYTF